MSNSLLRFIGKTENYKKYVKRVEEDCYSHEINSNETVTLTDGISVVHVSFSFNLFYLYNYYYILGFSNLQCAELWEKFIRNNYFDKDVFDLYDD